MSMWQVEVTRLHVGWSVSQGAGSRWVLTRRGAIRVARRWAERLDRFTREFEERVAAETARIKAAADLRSALGVARSTMDGC